MMTDHSDYYRDLSINPARRQRQRAIFGEVDRLFLDDDDTFQEMTRRLEEKGLVYTPAEHEEVAVEIRQSVAMAASNNAASGFKLTPEEIEEVTRRAYLRRGLAPKP